MYIQYVFMQDLLFEEMSEVPVPFHSSGSTYNFENLFSLSSHMLHTMLRLAGTG